MKYIIFSSLCLFSLLTAAAEDSTTLSWVELIPVEDRMAVEESLIFTDAHDHNESMGHSAEHVGHAAVQPQVGGVRKELTGKQVNIKGFALPIEGNDSAITAFLLVPYLNACSHTPPPTASQVIYVNNPKGTPEHQLWGLVSISGTLAAESTKTDFAEAGYKLDVETVSSNQ